MLHGSLAVVALLSLCALLTAAPGAAQAAGNPVVVIDTNFGEITLELDQDKAPITTANFLKYTDAKFFDGLIFHRVIPGFMIQGGGMTEKMAEKREGAFPPIKNEASNGLSNARGTISMARTNDPDSASSQFFINLVDNKRALDPRPGSAGYAVFGHVTAGMDVVDAIAKVPTGSKGPHDDVPLKPVVIKSVRRK